jgi:hypothetical protein
MRGVTRGAEAATLTRGWPNIFITPDSCEEERMQFTIDRKGQRRDVQSPFHSPSVAFRDHVVAAVPNSNRTETTRLRAGHVYDVLLDSSFGATESTQVLVDLGTPGRPFDPEVRREYLIRYPLTGQVYRESLDDFDAQVRGYEQRHGCR